MHTIAPVTELFAATPRQRCLVPKQRNVLAAIPRRERGDVQAELVGIWQQPTRPEALTQWAPSKPGMLSAIGEAVRSLTEDEEHLLTFYALPEAMYRHIQTTNAIESLFSNVRQRTDQIDVFTTENSCLSIVWEPFRISACTKSRCESGFELRAIHESTTSQRGWF